jgi:hypothetical protein
MTRINFLFLPYHNLGGHFLDWSLAYLSGKKQIWTNGQFSDLITNVAPDRIHFHHHSINMIHGFDKCQKLINDVNAQSVDSINVYLAPLPLHQVLDKMFNMRVEDATPDQIIQAYNFINADTQQMINWLQTAQHNVVFFDYKDRDYLNIVYNNRATVDYYGQQVADNDKLWDNYTSAFFNHSSKKFDKNIWDRREHLSLIIRFDKGIDFSAMVDRSLPHLYYNNDDVWNDALSILKEMIGFFHLTLDSTRLNNWQAIYNVWRTWHDPYFARHLDRIVSAIVNGEYLSLSRFNLNFYKEVLIQKELITKYNLNLKTWQLEKFPSNTQDLHKLLEPNIHIIESIY